jgi:hypothetical protein
VVAQVEDFLVASLARERTHDAAHHVVDECEVALWLAMPVDLNRAPGRDLVCKRKVCHVWTPPRSVDGEEPEADHADTVEAVVHMRNLLVRLLRRRVQ